MFIFINIIYKILLTNYAYMLLLLIKRNFYMKNIDSIKFFNLFEKEIQEYINKININFNVLRPNFTEYYPYISKPNIYIELYTKPTLNNPSYFHHEIYFKTSKELDEYMKTNKNIREHFLLIHHIIPASGKKHYCLGKYNNRRDSFYITATDFYPKSGPKIKIKEINKSHFDYHLNLSPFNENKLYFSKNQIDTLNNFYIN
jgi:hypothetical protein